MKNLDSKSHVRGESVYLDDVPLLEGTLFAAVFDSPVAHGKLISIDTSEAENAPGVVKIITAGDLPGENEIGGILPDEPLLADAEVHFCGMPVVLVDHEVDEGEIPSVSVDDVEGGRLAVRHLLDAGRRRIAYVSGPRSVRQVAERLEGAQAAIAEVPGATLEVIEQASLTVLQGRAAGEALAARAEQDRPDAVFAANDLLAVGLLQAFSFAAGVRVPEDIAMVGYDDIDFASATVVPLSSVRQPARLLGRTGVELLLQELDGADHDRRVRFQPELVVRDSSRG